MSALFELPLKSDAFVASVHYHKNRFYSYYPLRTHLIMIFIVNFDLPLLYLDSLNTIQLQ